MPSLITSCCKTSDWLTRALSKAAQFDDMEMDSDEPGSIPNPDPEINAEIQKMYETIPSQVLNPDEWVKGGGKRPIAFNQGAKNRTNKAISKITTGKYPIYPPWDEILLAMAKEGLVPINLDGSRFGNGILTGDAECGTEEARNQRVALRLAGKNADGMWCMTNLVVNVQWCKMFQSHKYEVVCYVS